MDPNKVARVVGLSSAVLLNKNDPYDPINRRISIIVMNKQAEESAKHDGGTLEVENPAGQPPATSGAAKPESAAPAAKPDPPPPAPPH